MVTLPGRVGLIIWIFLLSVETDIIHFVEHRWTFTVNTEKLNLMSCHFTPLASLVNWLLCFFYEFIQKKKILSLGKNNTVV